MPFSFPNIKPRYGMRKWSQHQHAEPLALSDCIEIVEYLKLKANIPIQQDIWDLEKVAQLVAKTKWRKLGFFSSHAVFIFLAPIMGVIFLLGLSCALSGEACTSKLSMLRFNSILLSGSFVAICVLWFKNAVSRDRQNTNFSEYFSPTLTREQREILRRSILELKNNNRTIFEFGNYEVFRKVSEISWTAENWFLLLTGNEHDRFAIWLDGAYPKGKLHLESNATSANTNDGETWSKVKSPNTRYIVSDRKRLLWFIQTVENISLKENHAGWLAGLKLLYDHHDIYKRYLDKKLSSEERNEFLDTITPVFARISRNFKKEVAKSGIDAVDLNAFGATGTMNFLHGRNENIENWIKKYT